MRFSRELPPVRSWRFAVLHMLVVLELLLYWPVVVGVGIVLVVVCGPGGCTIHTSRLILPCAAVHFNYIDRFLWHT